MRKRSFPRRPKFQPPVPQGAVCRLCRSTNLRGLRYSYGSKTRSTIVACIDCGAETLVTKQVRTQAISS